MNLPVNTHSDPEKAATTLDGTEPAVTTDAAAHPDPITGEPGAHPVGVGIGAFSAGAAGAAIGAIVGPIGALIGAAVGAVAGGLAGKEVAANADDPASLDVDDEAKSHNHVLAGHTADHPSAASVAANAAAAPVIPDHFSDTAVRPTADLSGESVSRGHTSAGDSVEATKFAASVPAKSDLAAHSSTVAPSDAKSLLTRIEEGAANMFQATSPSIERDTHHSISESPTAPVHSSVSEPPSLPLAQGDGLEETIRASAYYKYLDRQYTGRPGDEIGDWVEAEHDIVRG